MRYCLMVSGPAYGTQQAGSALQFARALLAAGHRIITVFFYQEGVHNANGYTSPAGDEVDMVRAWQRFGQQHDVALEVCVAAALRRGIADEREAGQLGLSGYNLQAGFILSGLGSLAQAVAQCDRFIQF
ncbi:sulfurtransferase complex subunit TusD [Sodalis sp. dw_96]|uniref:sulfurtransferase complex subunit TusD n=1 Tax=Sodalis sp. dw_96 TaxID=2719794 RepID=UPI002106D3E0|nr:sulfurtransferase complex subunit TusD [Sodalis sp. dw_96]